MRYECGRRKKGVPDIWGVSFSPTLFIFVKRRSHSDFVAAILIVTQLSPIKDSGYLIRTCLILIAINARFWRSLNVSAITRRSIASSDI